MSRAHGSLPGWAQRRALCYLGCYSCNLIVSAGKATARKDRNGRSTGRQGDDGAPPVDRGAGAGRGDRRLRRRSAGGSASRRPPRRPRRPATERVARTGASWRHASRRCSRRAVCARDRSGGLRSRARASARSARCADRPARRSGSCCSRDPLRRRLNPGLAHDAGGRGADRGAAAGAGARTGGPGPGRGRRRPVGDRGARPAGPGRGRAAPRDPRRPERRRASDASRAGRRRAGRRGWSAISPQRRAAASCGWSTRGISTSPTAGSAASRRCCAGGTRCAASWRRGVHPAGRGERADPAARAPGRCARRWRRRRAGRGGWRCR